jgi:tRNA A-37 threonylcarbamoyl transferase component Bud32
MPETNYNIQQSGEWQWLTHKSLPPLNERELKLLVEKQLQMKDGAHTSDEVRTSRGSFWVTMLPSGRKVIVRQYKRGGVIAQFITESFYYCPHINWPKLRSFSEFENTLYLKEKNFCVPMPLFAVTQKLSAWRYKAFIGYEYLEGSQNLLVESRGLSFNRLNETFYAVGKLACDMLDLGVMHSDLHLGNVLLHGTKIYIIDFDKSYRINQKTDYDKCRMQLIDRWRRSLKRHNMTENLIEPYIQGLNYKLQ